MEQKLFTELRYLCVSTKESPSAIRIRIRMRDLIDPDILRRALDTTMTRYPYFCVELAKMDGQYIFIENRRSVVITHSLHGVDLNSKESNYHMLALGWMDNWIIFDAFHGMTDATGAYEVLRTLLYYYCSERYNIQLKGEGIRLSGDEISEEEWSDPVESKIELPKPKRHEQMSYALNLTTLAGLKEDHRHTVYSIAVSEKEFMKFNKNNNCNPGTMVSLLLSRAIAKLFPEANDIIRIALCMNQRKALHAPLAHHSLVGGASLEYKDEMRDWPLDKQASTYQGMVFAQSQDENVLRGVASNKEINATLLSKKSDQERLEVADYINALTASVVTATVSYVGKANYGEAERYIRDFRLWTSPAANGLTVEISAVNGRFTFDFLQTFSSSVFVNAFLKELDENGIVYDLQDVNELELPNIKLPWTSPRIPTIPDSKL